MDQPHKLGMHNIYWADKLSVIIYIIGCWLIMKLKLINRADYTKPYCFLVI